MLQRRNEEGAWSLEFTLAVLRRLQGTECLGEFSMKLTCEVVKHFVLTIMIRSFFWKT